MNKELLKQQIIIDEGLKLRPYKDTENIWTVACGRNLEGKGLSKDEQFFLGIKAKTKEEVISYLLENPLTKEDCLYLLDNDIDDIWNQLKKAIPWVVDQPEVIQRVLCNMAFMGVARLMEFKKTLAFLKAKKYEDAAREMLNSKWASQVHDRAVRLSNLVKAQANA